MEKNIDFKRIFEEAMEKLGKVNIIIAGKTGVGKSTLLNAVFGEDLAVTGTGKPVTQTMKEYSKEGTFYHIFDTKGFELDSYKSMKDDLVAEIQKRRTNDPKEHIHIMWYCIENNSARFEGSEQEFIKEIAREIPVVVVLTKAYTKDLTLYNTIKDELFNVNNVNVNRVVALPTEIDENYTIPAKGLNELIEVTYENIPEAAQSAFVAAQKVNEEIRQKAVNKAIAIAVSAAAAVSATPIPFSDAVLLAPIQIGMFARISSLYGLKLSEGFLSTLVTSAAGVLVGTIAGRIIVTNLIKLIPGVGSIVGGVISAGTAGVLTTIMGKAYAKTLETIVDNGVELAPEAIGEEFKKQLKLSKYE